MRHYFLVKVSFLITKYLLKILYLLFRRNYVVRKHINTFFCIVKATK